MNDFGGFGSHVRIVESSASTVLKGVFYRLACVIPTCEAIVVSFDMGDEVFRKIGLPPPCLEETWDEINLQIAELKDELAVVFYSYSDDRCFDAWVLNEDQSSWTNQFKVDITHFEVVRGAKNGEFVVKDHSASGDLKLFSYDPKTGKTTDLYFG